VRLAGPVWIVPTPALLWTLLLVGHALSAGAPVPALLEETAHTAALVAGAGSLAAALLRERPHGWFSAKSAWRAEVALGIIAMLLAGAALGAEADRRLWPLPVHPRETEVEVEGIVLDAAAIDARAPSALFEIRRLRVGGVDTTCSARVTLRWAAEDPSPGWITPGLWLRLVGSFRPPEDARNFGVSAPGRWAERAGLAGTIRVRPGSIVAPADPPVRGATWDAYLRDRAARAFGRRACEPVAALARGMLIGDRSGIGADVRNAFRDGGTIHVISISGLHVVILAGFIAAAAAALRLPAAPAVLFELLVLWAYVLLVGAPASALRSALLWTATRWGRVQGRVVRPFTAWGLAGLAIHLFDPRAVLDPGFQLSFAAVLGLGAARPLAPRGSESGSSGPPRARGRLAAAARGTASLFVQSAGATAGTAALQAGLFGAVPLSGLLLNLAVIPLCTVFMGEAIFALAADLTGVGWLADAAGGALDACGLLLFWLHAHGAHALPPWILRESSPAWILALSSGALLVAWARGEAARAEPRGRGSARIVSMAAFGFSLATPTAWAVATPPPPRASLVIVSLDVGQGDATWIGLPGSTSFLIDAGPEGESYDAGSAVVEPFLRAERSGPLAFALLSHAHSDHYGGFPWLAARGWVGALYENGSDPRGAWRSRLTGRWMSAGARAVARDTVLWNGDVGNDAPPVAVRMRTGLPAGPENDRSLTAFVHASGATSLFPGDLENAGEEGLLDRAPGEGPARVLKAPHHGSPTSSGKRWVLAWRPDIVIVSCGERNRFRHPDAAVVGRYLAAGAEVLRTDREGAIRITVADSGAWISTRAEPAPRLVRWRPYPR
jgi:competence protein ComEC